ncbi:hypothetical protein EA58_17820 [Photobacterium galatheae]|uniref:Uncharacterized protein n=1 Tax=Photobacterium galatheae TaxID=1654360 RepID=A0A066RJ53_9GAMM|nr:hypothetical protein EA58_17820 [Photobacterium galatheae]
MLDEEIRSARVSEDINDGELTLGNSHECDCLVNEQYKDGKNFVALLWVMNRVVGQSEQGQRTLSLETIDEKSLSFPNK